LPCVLVRQGLERVERAPEVVHGDVAALHGETTDPTDNGAFVLVLLALLVDQKCDRQGVRESNVRKLGGSCVDHQ
jgi:hypothetical protein